MISVPAGARILLATRAADTGKLFAAMRQDRVDQRAVFVPRCGVDDKAGGFVENDQVAILIEESEGYSLRPGYGWLGRWDIEAVRGARSHRFGRLCDHLAVAARKTLLDQRLDARA